MSHYKTKQWLLAADLIILNLGQVTRYKLNLDQVLAPELASLSPNYHTSKRKLSLDRFYIHNLPPQIMSSGTRTRSSIMRFVKENLKIFAVKI
ncbi:hypothetical protein TNCV_4031701 [Trichonephila clavipes]|nr:hypothetical protein TNCV_4031701 [Trichonephila clavipes]